MAITREPPISRALVVIPGSVNYFYNQAGRRIAVALGHLGLEVNVRTLQSIDEQEYDWCFLINTYEVSVSIGNKCEALQRIAKLRVRCNHMAAVLLECVKTKWFTLSLDLCKEANIETLLDLGFHNQSMHIPLHLKPRYHFVFNGLNEAEQRSVRNISPAIDDRPIPWVFIGHSSRPRVSLTWRLVRDIAPDGFVYMPDRAPVTENGPHINEQQLKTILTRARYQIWCAQHEHFYMESERFRNSLLAGCVPIKVMLYLVDNHQSLPFHYLLLDEKNLAAEICTLEFKATWQRFADEFYSLPTLEDSLANALTLMNVQRPLVREAIDGQ